MFQVITGLYAVSLPRTLLTHLKSQASAWQFLRWFWTTKRYDAPNDAPSPSPVAISLVGLGMVMQIIFGVALLIEWARIGHAEHAEFGAAAIISYPVVWAHLLALVAVVAKGAYYVAHPKKLGRAIVCVKLEHQVRQLRKRHDFTVVAVAGSVGKTSTKLAIAELLGQNVRVRHQTGNYNDRVTVPLVFFGEAEPSLFNVVAWSSVFRRNSKAIAAQYPYDVVVVELGTDAPGQLQDFAYIHPDITVVTAVSPEHMEYFKTLDAVAAEELAVFDYSETVIVNGDDIAGEYLAGKQFAEYSLTSKQAQYRAAATPEGLTGQALTLHLDGQKITAQVRYIGEQGAKFALAAAAVSDILKVPSAEIANGLTKLTPFAGRMQILAGVNGSTLIDDTYNASPIAVKAALDVLYTAKTTQRIAILGSMNELGDYSQEAHAEVGAYCDPKKLATVVTIGADAEKWLAPAAIKAGCNVVSFKRPYDAGEYVKSMLKKNAVVLAKGSQNGVFAEEALKPLLKDKKDMQKLVRQSPYWLKIKATQFPN